MMNPEDVKATDTPEEAAEALKTAQDRALARAQQLTHQSMTNYIGRMHAANSAPSRPVG